MKAILATLLMTATAMPAVASITYENQDQVQEHIELLETLDELGINVVINGPHCNQDLDVAGYWNGSQQIFGLCQQSIRRSKLPSWNGKVVLATDDDLDTIRHEAHHVIQDCMDGRLDGNLRLYMNDTNRAKFLSYYPDWKEEYIAEQYRDAGANAHTIRLEIEAWAVADMVPATMINQALKRECKV